MITWNKDRIARFLNCQWGPLYGHSLTFEALFPMGEGYGALQVNEPKGIVELSLYAAGEKKLASWHYLCGRIDVHDDLRDSPCIKFWPPKDSTQILSWFEIYRRPDGFSIFTCAAHPLLETVGIPSAEHVPAN